MAAAKTQNQIAVYNGGGAFDQTPIDTAFNSSLKNMSLLVACITSFKWTCDSITDSLGNTWTQAVSTTQGGSYPDYADIWYAYCPQGGANTVSPHFTNVDGSGHITSLVLSEWSGMAVTGVLDRTNGATNTGTAVSPGAITPSANGEVIISVATDYNGTLDATVTNQTGYSTLNQQLGNNGTYIRLYSEYLIQDTAAATTASFTLGSSSTWQCSVASFKAAPASNMQVNIEDAWKTVAGMQINIGDAWKNVVGVQVNIGDAWKTVY